MTLQDTQGGNAVDLGGSVFVDAAASSFEVLHGSGSALMLSGSVHVTMPDCKSR